MGLIATVAVHGAVLLLLLVSSRAPVPIEPAPVAVRMLSDTPAQQQSQPLPMRVNAVLARPQLHMAQPEIVLADSAPGPSSPVSASSAPSSSAESQQAVIDAPPRFDADYLDNPPPRYPALSRRMREQGVVLLRVYVLPNGLPDIVELKRSSGSVRLDDSALNAVRHWKFVPAQSAGRAVAAWVVVPIEFNLTA